MTAKRIDPKEANALMAQGWVYVDVRTEAEFAGGHPKGALNVPLNSPDFLAVMQKLFKPDAKLIVGCQMGGRSARACMLLASHGFRLTRVIPGFCDGTTGEMLQFDGVFVKDGG